MKDRNLYHIQQIGQYRNQAIEKTKRIWKQKHNNSEIVETSSDQLPHQSFDEQNLTRMSHRSYRKVTYHEQLQACIFTDNNTLVPVETSRYIIFREPTSRNFRYNPKTRQFRQVMVEECKWTTRCLLCQDLIFNQVTCKTNYIRQGRNGQTQDKWVSDLWFKAPEHDEEIGQGHNFEIIQDEYLRNLDMIDPLGEGSEPYQMKDYRHM